MTHHTRRYLGSVVRGVAWAFVLAWCGAPRLGAAEVSGRVTMPDVCAPEVSPAVVMLEPAGGRGVPVGASRAAAPAEVVLVSQRGLQFVPRVQAVVPGQAVRFTNEDAETHNVHVISPGHDFNESMAPGQPREFTPSRPGVVRLACDVHGHMRGYLVVSPTPWVRVCSARGRFRIDDVPDGTYTLTVWHEMGQPLRRPVTVTGGKDLELDGLVVEAATPAPRAAAAAAPRPWSEVVDAIGVRLARGLDAAVRAHDAKAARRHADDAYWDGFESSDMETAVRLHLGLARTAELEQRFRAVAPTFRDLAEGRAGAEPAVDAIRQLLLALNRTGGDLDRKGVTDAAHLDAGVPASATAGPDSARVSAADLTARLDALAEALGGVRNLADRGDADDAAAAMSAVYFEEFEPIERYVGTRRPGDVRPLEFRFSEVRGRVGGGLKGAELAAALDGFTADVRGAVGRASERGAGAFGPAFAAALVTTLREGIEVILLLAMLIAVAARAGRPGALRAVAAGVVLAVLASAATAAGLHRLVASAQGRSRELLEGGVMLAAAAVLFYVSYWLISQSESKRWADFLRRKASLGGERLAADAPRGLGDGRLTLLATAFLAVYREGAETALMFQAMIGTQGGSQTGLSGLAAGLGVGVVLLAGVAWLVRVTSVRLPLRGFFRTTGALLFAMAVIFAGNGVFELQQSGVLRNTPVAWIGAGLPLLGVHPSTQALSVQALLLAGAALAGLVLLLGGDPGPDGGVRPTRGTPPTPVLPL